MKDVRIILGQAFEALTAIAKDHNLKSDKLDDDALNALLSDLAKLNELTEEAKRRAAGHIEVTLYMIGKETAPGEYAGFTHGPNPSKEDLLSGGVEHTVQLEDGDALVKSVQVGGVLNHVTLAIWLDNQWNETGDELKEVTA